MYFFKKSMYNFFIMLINVSYNFIPFFVLKRFFLKSLGANIGKFSNIHTPVRFLDIKKGNIKIQIVCWMIEV